MILKDILQMMHDRTVYIDTTELKWGSEYDGGVQYTRHTRVRVGNHTVSYNYVGVQGLIATLQLLPDINIIINGEVFDADRSSSTKNS